MTANADNNPQERTTVDITFDTGEEAEEVSLTWGQRAVLPALRFMQGRSGFLNQARIVRLPAGTTMDSLTAALGLWMESIETLRIQLLDMGEDSRQGTFPWRAPRQRIAGSGCITMEVRSMKPGGEVPLSYEDATSIIWELGDFTVAGIIVCIGDTPTVLGVTMGHLLVDKKSCDLAVARLEEILATGSVETDRLLVQVREQLALEASDAGIRHTKAAVKHWRRELTRFPVDSFQNEIAPNPDFRFKSLVLASKALPLVITRIAESIGVSTTAVLLGANIALLSKLSQKDPVGTSLIVGNRFRDRERGAIITMCQNSVMTLDVAGKSLYELMHDSSAASLRALRCAFYEPEAVIAVQKESEAALGHKHDLEIYFNDGRRRYDWDNLPHRAGPDEVRALAEKSTIEQNGEWNIHDAKYFAAVDSDVDALHFSVLFDTAFTSEETMRTHLFALEKLLITAMSADVDKTSIRSLLAGHKE